MYFITYVMKELYFDYKKLKNDEIINNKMTIVIFYNFLIC